nr:unnamed protein product [Callosobruchus analis]
MTTDRRKIRDLNTADQMWKVYIRSEDDSGKFWKENWGWILDEYRKLKEKLDEKTADSEFLSGVAPPREIPDKKISPVPESFNHWYGWIAKEEDFKLDKYGPDFFKPLPLPDIYKIVK